MKRWFESVADLTRDESVALLRARRYGVIEMERGRLVAVHFRPWPKLFVDPQTLLSPPGFHRRGAEDRCWLYYNQPRSALNFLALKFIISSEGGTFASVRWSIAALDIIARIKKTDAIVCEAYNPRLSERLLARWGWERHVSGSRRRHYIKRFYGAFPPLPPVPCWSDAPQPSPAPRLGASDATAILAPPCL